MTKPSATPSNSRAMRLIHMALVLGTTLSGVVFVIVRRMTPPPVLAQTSIIGIVLAVSAIAMFGVALTVLRPRVPQQAPGQSIDGLSGRCDGSGDGVRGEALLQGESICVPQSCGG
jgi:hypothetical protein